MIGRAPERTVPGLTCLGGRGDQAGTRPGWLSRVAPWLSPQGLLWGLITVILAVLVLLPLYHLLRESVHTPAGLSWQTMPRLLS